jgi:hypothetical protein
MIRFNTTGSVLIGYRRAGLIFIAGLLFSLIAAGCGGNAPEPNTNTSSSQPQANPPAKKTGTYITAEPNPVPAGPGAGATKISWGLEGKPVDLHVYVSTNDGKETIFADTAGSGYQDAPWIVNDAKYEFRLYSGSGADRKLLDKVVVTRQK